MRGAAVGLMILCAAPAFANSFERFYQPVPSPPTIASEEAPQLYISSGETMRDVNALWGRGFAAVGLSSFNGPPKSDAEALAFAKKLGARWVIRASAHTGTRTGALATPFLGGAIVTPLVTERFDQQALFFKPIIHKGMGVLIGELTDQQKQEIGSNRGLMVRAIREGSPAYQADLLPGDLLLTIDGKGCDTTALKEAIANYSQPMAMTLLRGGAQKTVTVTIPEEWR